MLHIVVEKMYCDMSFVHSLTESICFMHPRCPFHGPNFDEIKVGQRHQRLHHDISDNPFHRWPTVCTCIIAMRTAGRQHVTTYALIQKDGVGLRVQLSEKSAVAFHIFFSMSLDIDYGYVPALSTLLR